MQRPTSVTVFGILNILWGLFGLFGNAVAAVMMVALAAAPPNAVVRAQTSPAMMAWVEVNLALGAIACIALVASGIGLLNMKPWGRKVSIGYAIYALFSAAVGLAVQGWFVTLPVMQEVQHNNSPESAAAVGGLIGGIFGGCLSCIYPVLLWYFMSRPQVVAAIEGMPAPSDGLGPTGSALVREVSSNPYLSPAADLGPLAPGAGGPRGAVESVVETFIPSKNGPALAAYYLGIFSLFPCLGFPLGVAAVYYGLKGRRLVRDNPEVRGGAHAWVGIICGSLFGLFNVLAMGLNPSPSGETFRLFVC